MYLMITSRCNMTCAHCCSSCTAKGEDMTAETFSAAIRMAEEYGYTISIGGGEPTLHPLFWSFFGEALGANVEYVWMATNGKITKTALALAGLAKGSERFSCALSQDRFHDPIEQRVVDAFRRANLELRDTSQNLSNTGRAKKNNLGHDDHCVCGGLSVKPNGDIKPCGCAGVPTVGNVHNGIYEKYREALESDEYRDCECWRGYRAKKTRKGE